MLRYGFIKRKKRSEKTLNSVRYLSAHIDVIVRKRSIVHTAETIDLTENQVLKLICISRSFFAVPTLLWGK